MLDRTYTGTPLGVAYRLPLANVTGSLSALAPGPFPKVWTPQRRQAWNFLPRPLETTPNPNIGRTVQASAW